jgi:membrane protein
VDLLRPLRAFDRRQQTQRWLAFPVAVIKKFSDDQGGSLAALVAYYSFFSLFPLLLVFVTVLGFVLQGDPGAQKSVENSVLGQFPIIGEKITPHGLEGKTAALVIGLLTSLWAGLGVTQAAQNALDTVWAVPFKHRSDFVYKRLRGLALLISLGVLFLVSSLASGLVLGGLGGTALKIGGIAFSLLLNCALFMAAFRLMTSDTVQTRCLWVGVLFAAVFWEILQALGGVYIGHVLKNTTGTYAQFGFVIALLIWLHLGAQLTLFAAEINVVLNRKLWPRSLFSPAVPADERALTALAKVEERTEAEKIDVRFEREHAGRPGGDGGS